MGLCWHISDTHCLHDQLKVPKGASMVIHSGDCSNSRDSAINANEVLNFLEWFSSLAVEHKIFVAGNHDVSIERRLVTPEYIRSLGIYYLENEWGYIGGFNFWGSPISPSFGEGWSWNVSRHKTHNVWDNIPDQTDILITHGPPKGVLDLSRNAGGDIEMCGCKSLASKILQVKPKAVCFGHIHDSKDFKNAGLRKISSHATIYSNGCCILDGRMELVNNGNILIL
jgi:Icc-related predicted phosphoesterase